MQSVVTGKSVILRKKRIKRVIVVTRLGSGRGSRDFRTSRSVAHGYSCGLPRYPWRFGEGTKIRWVGDAAWWWVINRLQKKIIRLPMVVGNYHSHPGEQAEFRKMPYDELAPAKRVWHYQTLIRKP